MAASDSDGVARLRGRAGDVLLGAFAAVSLALAVGAKLYPVVLLPIFVVGLARVLGWRWSLGFLALFCGACWLALLPLVPPASSASAVDEARMSGPAAARQELGGADGLNAAAECTAGVRTREGSVGGPLDPNLGLKTFLRRWEMNEFLFLLLFENLKPEDAIPPQESAWFSFLPESWRQTVNRPLQACLPLDAWESAFWLTRVIMALIFLAIVASFLRRVYQAGEPAVGVECSFLTLAWFWLLSPTQNPWYWTWALPLVPWARSRVWLAMSGLALLYYFRFWLRYHFPEPPVLGVPYRGEVFFDLIVTWVEYAPWLVCLAVSSCLHARRSPRGTG